MTSYLRSFLQKYLCVICPPLYRCLCSDCNTQRRSKCPDFLWGFALGQIYYYYLLRRIPFPYYSGVILSVILSLLLGVSNAISMQIRCISLLLYPMFCGKAGRGVLKVVVLTYVVAGPITNMGMNAREVVRVFACSAQLSYNLSKEQHSLMAEPFRKTAINLASELDQIKDTFGSITDIVAPIEHEVESKEELQVKREENDNLDRVHGSKLRSQNIEKKFQLQLPKQLKNKQNDKEELYQKLYEKKLAYRCENQLTHAVTTCMEAFGTTYEQCQAELSDAPTLCYPLKLDHVCSIMDVIGGNNACDTAYIMDPGFGEGYLSLKRAKYEFTNHMDDVKLQYKISYEKELYEIQDAKETGELVMHAFEEKTTIMGTVAVVLNVYVAFLFLRIVSAAIHYHDKYLTKIEFDNIYVTRYFKQLDKRRQKRGEMTLLPLKKMERLKYIDLSSLSYKDAERSTLLAQILKVMLEMVTATTFVMLDRLFYEALDVVRQHAQSDPVLQDLSDLKMEVEGTGMLATLFRKLLSNVSSRSAVSHEFTNQQCLPQPRAMPFYFYFKIYGGYLWILLLLYVNPYTLRLRRLICSYFYPRREKQRILHLYNDILKKRLKIHKTLRRKAVQAVRAHYLSGENLLSLRIKFPRILGWLRVLPAARMACLICGETEPRADNTDQKNWHACRMSKCPFVFCGECWREAGARCLACDPSLVELSDIDSLSEDERPEH